LLWQAGQVPDIRSMVDAWLNTDASKKEQNAYSSE